MKLKNFLRLYDNWNGVTRLNDNNLDTIVENITHIIIDRRGDLLNREVVAFGFYDGILTIRLK